MGFGFEPALGGTDPRLGGRQLISFTTSGAPDSWMHDTGALDALKLLFETRLSGAYGLSLIDHVHFGGMVSGITPEAYAEVIDRVRAAVVGHFASARRRNILSA